MDIASIIISSIAVVGIIVLLIVLLTKKGDKASFDSKEINDISNKIDNIASNNKKDVELVMAIEMAKLSEKNNEKLERFQSNITDNLQNRFDSLNKQVNEKMENNLKNTNEGLEKINVQALKNSELNNEKLERFQQTISDSLQTRFDALNKQVDDKFIEINKKVDDKIGEGFKGTSETMAQVRERLQAIDDAQKNIEKLSTDVVSLKNVLEGNQTRGQYGEYQLSMVLHNVFGDTEGCYQEQYTIKRVKDGDDVRADAAVFMPEPNKLICIDSKFPFQDYARMFDTDDENEKAELLKEFNKAVKGHITVIKDKYIVEGKTAQQALMFIPNDGVFAFIHHNSPEVVEYAREKRVILTSPSTLPAILVTINMVKLEAQRAKNAKIISDHLAKLGKQFELFNNEWESLSKQLDTASRTREKLDSRVSRITTRFDAIKDSNLEEDLAKLEDSTLEIEEK